MGTREQDPWRVLGLNWRIPQFWTSSIFVIIVASRIPFLFFGHLQEDAFIHFRIARHFWDTGEFAYNAGEPLLATTSPAYVLLISPLFLLPDSVAIVLVQILGSAATVGAIYILAPLFGARGHRVRLLAVLAIASTPVAIVASTTGMEIPFVLLALAIIARSIETKQHIRIAIVLSLLLPSIRLDSLAQLAATSIPGYRRNIIAPLALFSAGVAGLLLQLATAKFLFNDYLPQSIQGKATSYSIGHLGVTDRLLRIFESFAQVAVPIDTKFLDQFESIWVLIGAIATGIVLKYGKFSTRLKLSSVAISWGIPAAYAVSGTQLFPWYFWLSSIWLYAMTIVSIMSLRPTAQYDFHGLSLKKLNMPLIIGAIIVIFYAGQLVTSYANGTEERKYRKEVGDWIQQNSLADDSLMLVPIGIIGFESELYIHDEIALVSPAVEDYRKQFGLNWWTRYLEDYSPDFLLQTDRILEGRSPSALLTESELAYFNENYQLVRRFEYVPDDYSTNTIARKLLSLGSADSYNLYQRR